MKTLITISQDVVTAQAKIDALTTRRGYPDATGTERYAEDAVMPEPVPELDENGDPTGVMIQPDHELVIAHGIQENELLDGIPSFHPDLETDFDIHPDHVKAKDANADANAEKLVGNVHSNIIDLTDGELTAASEEAITELVNENNIIISVDGTK